MDQLRRMMATIQVGLGGMKATHKLLIGSVIVIMVLAMVVVQLMTAKTNMVELLPGAPVSDQQRAAGELGKIGLVSKFEGGKLVVRSEDEYRARAVLSENNVLPNDKALIFENILLKQNWTNSRQQNEQLYNRALATELQMTISKFSGIKSANVFLDIPEPMGLGASVRRPTATASVTTANGQPLSQGQVDAIANFIAGSKAGLSVDSVRVIDAIAGRQRKATSEDAIVPTTYMEHAARVEQVTREKVQELLGYIPGVVVAVTAQVDVTQARSVVNSNLPEKQGTLSMVKKTIEDSTKSNQTTGGAEPGVGANQTADINNGAGGGSGAGTSTEKTTSTTEMENHVGSKNETIVDPKGYPTMVALSVNIPRGFVASLIKAATPAAGTTPAPAPAGGAAAGPDDAAIKDKFEKDVKPAIIEMLKPQVRAMMVQSGKAPTDLTKLVDEAIAVSMMPIDLPPLAAPQTAGIFGGSSASGGGGSLMGIPGSLIDKGVLGILALVSLGMMMMMLKKVSKRTETPTAEELVGLPPSIEAPGEVIGEADESETPMEGIEVDDGLMKSQKILEQVTELVEKTPDSAARLLNRWMSVQD